MSEVDTPIIKISLPGYDAGKATPEQCSLHSAYPFFKSYNYLTNNISQTFNYDTSIGEYRTLSIPHNYPFTPVVILYEKISSLSDYSLVIHEPAYYYAGSMTGGVGYSVDSNNLNIVVYSGVDDRGGPVSVTYNFRYSIFAHDWS